MKRPHVFFFRGLSTYGGDNAQWAFLDFGPMYKHFAAAFRQRGVEFTAVTGMGSGTLPEVTARALEFIRADSRWRAGEPVHFCGHSAGGLVARMCMAELASSGQVRSVLTIASPNRGSRLARLFLDMPVNNAGSARWLRLGGYDLAKKSAFFSDWTEESLGRIFPPAMVFPPSRQPVIANGARLASIVCAQPRAGWSWPLRLLYRIKALREFEGESDGLVEKVSQGYGQVLAELEIDHIRQIGIFGQRQKFEHLCDVAADFIKDV